MLNHIRTITAFDSHKLLFMFYIIYSLANILDKSLKWCWSLKQIEGSPDIRIPLLCTVPVIMGDRYKNFEVPSSQAEI